MNLTTKAAANFCGGLIGAALTLIVGLCLWWFRIGESLSNLSYDLPFVFVSQAITNDVVIVKMDDISRLELNQTAGLWNRRIHAHRPLPRRR